MRDLNWYIDSAKKISGAKSDRSLSALLGLSGGGVVQWRTGRAYPSDDAMVQLANIAHVDPQIALIELNTWRTNGPSRKMYEGILNNLHKFASMLGLVLIAGILFGPSQAMAAGFAPISAQSTLTSFLTDLYIITLVL